MKRSPYAFEYRLRLWILFGSKPLLALTVAALSGSLATWYAPQFQPLQAGAGCLLATAGLAVRLWASSFMDDRVVSSLHPDARDLVTSGPYSISRNPLYVGTMLMFVGYACFFGFAAAIAFGLFHLIRYQRIIRCEELVLSREWGRQFDRFLQTTGRWLPTNVRQLRRIRLRGPFLSSDALLLNGLFVGMWMGCLASAVSGSLATLIPIEVLGGLVAGGAHLMQRRRLLSLPADPLASGSMPSSALEPSPQRVA